MARLSVVVPIHNVAGYLPAALSSLASQTLRDIEVVMVDDGSTDRSPVLAAEVAARDRRFRLVQQPNHGLGHARNTGIRHATGEFLAFVDSDDIVPHYGYRTALRTLEETGSDFLSGNEYRIDSRGARPVPMLESNFGLTRLRTSVSEHPSLLRDLLPHNKVYRRAFWEAAGLEFPEGILFEDGPVGIRAHALAKSVDVITTPIYYWRLREDTHRSLSQLADDERFFVDRIHASTLSADFLEANRPDLLHAFYRWELQHKLVLMYKALPQAPRAVQQRFMHAAVPHLRRVPVAVVKGLPPALRRQVRATRTGSLAAVLRVLPGATAPASAAAARALRRAPRVLGQSTTLRAIRALASPPPPADAVQSAVTELGRQGERLRLRGYGYLAGLPADGPLTARNRVLWARHQESHRLVRLSLHSRPAPEATAGDAYFSYRRSGFEAELRIADLRDPAGRWRYGTWLFALGVLTARGVARGGLKLGAETDLTELAPIPLDGTTRLVPRVTNGVLGFRIAHSVAALEQCRVDGSHLIVTGRVTGPVEASATAYLGRVNGVPELSIPVAWRVDPDGPARFTATVSLPDLVRAVSPVAPTPVAGVPDRLGFGVRLRAGDLAWQQLACDGGFVGLATTVARHHIAIQPDLAGCLAVTVRPPGPVLTEASWTDAGELRLRGSGADQVCEVQLVGCRNGHREQRSLPGTVSPDGSWQVRFSPDEVSVDGSATGPAAGGWRLILRSTAGPGEPMATDLPYSPQLFAGAPSHRIAHSDRYSLARVGPDGLALRVGLAAG